MYSYISQEEMELFPLLEMLAACISVSVTREAAPRLLSQKKEREREKRQKEKGKAAAGDFRLSPLFGSVRHQSQMSVVALGAPLSAV